MPELMEIQPTAPIPATLRETAEPAAMPPRESPAIVPSFRFIPSPAPMLGHRWLDTFEIARLYAEAAQRNLISGADTTRPTNPATRVSPGEKTRG
jgi:hypothetical protein